MVYFYHNKPLKIFFLTSLRKSEKKKEFSNEFENLPLDPKNLRNVK